MGFVMSTVRRPAKSARRLGLICAFALACATLTTSSSSAPLGLSEGTSAPFTLYLGSGYRQLTAGIGSAESPPAPIYLASGYRLLVGGTGFASASPFALYLAPGFAARTAGRSEVVGASFVLYLGPGNRPIGLAAALSQAFPLDTRLLVVMQPSAGELWRTGDTSPSSTHTVIWIWNGGAVDHFKVILEYSTDGGTTYRNAILTDPGVSGDQIPVAAPYNSTHARIRVEADAGGSPIYSSTSDQIVVWAPVIDHVLLSSESPVFTWPPIPPCSGWTNSDVGGYELWWEREPLSDTRDPVLSPFDGTIRTVPRATSYYSYHLGEWGPMVPGIYSMHIRALRVDGGPSCEYPSQRFARANIKKVRDGAPPQAANPVLLLHGIWSSCDETFGCDFTDALKADGYETWTLDYPNIDDIREGAACLKGAIGVLRALHPAAVEVIAHSMGGLVSRTYIQSLARDPQAVANTPSGQTPPTLPYRAGDIDALIMLSTPNRSAHTDYLWELEHVGRRPRPLAAKQIETVDDDHLLSELNHHFARESSVRHLFLQGDKAGDHFSGSACGDPNLTGFFSITRVPGFILPDKNDGAVEASKAIVDPRDFSQTDQRRCVPRSHRTISRVKSTSGDYNNIIRPFLQGQGVANETRDEECFAWWERPVTFTVEPAQQFVPYPHLAGRSPMNRAGLDAQVGPLAGALVTLSPVGSDSLSTFAGVTGADGNCLIPFVTPGPYFATVATRGFGVRTLPVHVDSLGDGLAMVVTVDPDSTYAGPTSPGIAIGSGRMAIYDSTVTLYPTARNATEMLVGSDPSFAESSWQPYATSIPYQLDGGSGLRVVYATFRNATGVTSDTVGTAVILAPDSLGSISVTSSPDSAEVSVGGFSTGRRTPTTLDSLPVGGYTIVVARSGYKVPSGPVIANVTGGGTTDLHFDLSPAGSPSIPLVAAVSG